MAKALVDRAGPDVKTELVRYRAHKHKMRQGELAITTGGATGAIAIFHPAVIDLDETRYATPELIRQLVRRCLACADAIGAESIAFPAFGGGTASKPRRP